MLRQTQVEANPSFVPLPPCTGMHYDNEDIAVFSLFDQSNMGFIRGTYYVYVVRGYAVYSGGWLLSEGCYGSFTEGQVRSLYNSEILVVQKKNYHGIMNYGGPIERRGRLKYIDGCTDTCIIPPLKYGDPCLNHLHFPPNILQTQHTHPDIRVGVVARGEGVCITPWEDVPMLPGTQFLIMPENGETKADKNGVMQAVGLHNFKTFTDAMDVVAFHPSSDWGPTDEAHPMILQTKLVGNAP